MLNQLWLQFQMGGWMMWVIFAQGFVALAAAGRFGLRGEYQLLGFLKWMLRAQLTSGALGMGMGMIMVLKAAVARASVPNLEPATAQVRAVLILCEGTGEALNCLTASLLFTLLIVSLIAVGVRRFPEPNASAVV